MSYLRRSLGMHEELMGQARYHWLYKLGAWLALITLFWCLIGIYMFFHMMIKVWTTEIGVTNHRFIKKTGLFSLHAEEISLPNIEGVTVRQSFWGRLFGYGQLRIEGTGVDHIETPDMIADPVGLRRAIETAKEAGIARH